MVERVLAVLIAVERSGIAIVKRQVDTTGSNRNLGKIECRNGKENISSEA